jgi:glycerol uptake facilitator-like aquaporin
MAAVVPNEAFRRLITGFLFGTTGASIALSPVAKIRGAHINPIVTMAFRLMGKLAHYALLHHCTTRGCRVRLDAALALAMTSPNTR